MGRPSLEDAALFAAIVDAGGFRSAAERRGLAPSSLSDAVRRLEAALGVRLLNRTTRNVSPTEAGARLLARLQPALGEAEAAFNDVADERDGPTGTLRLNVPVPVARHVLPDLAAEFLERHPLVRLDVVMDNAFRDVFADGFDAGVRYGERIGQDMIAVPIGPRVQRFAAAAAPAYLARREPPEHPRDLAIHRLIANSFPSGAIGVWEFERDGELVSLTPEGPLVTSSIDLQVASARAGLGVIYTFEDYLRSALDAGALRPVLEDWWQAFEGPFLYYQSRRHMPSPLRAFVDLLHERRSRRNP